MQAIPSPAGRWTEISVDVVSSFSSVPFLGTTMDSVLVVVDLFSSHVHFHPINKSFSLKDFENILLMNHLPLHGIPSIIHSDQGSQFTHHAVQALLKNLGSPSNFSVSAHHQSNCMAERYIRTLQDYLRCFIQENDD
ncbi:unnamed protein product [Ambrosiozyma monospora]|uniref:Unnamed protein product n=1 Tax=Ambrosiozyma monospora TaxID=43982 RepID=A0ACB5T0G6_AMBMO|nr:unnamed protein product [Ambrosiozyma monospora]